MRLAARLACGLYGALAVAVAVGLYRQEPWATRIWPWPDDRLTYIYLASLAAAIAAPFLYVAWSDELAMLAPVALDAMVASGGMALYLGYRAEATGDRSMAIAAAGLAIIATAFALLFGRVRRMPLRDTRLAPDWVRWIMGVLAAVVVVIGAGLLARVDGVYPWDLRTETSTMFGLVYLGVAVYFAYAAAHPVWAMTAGQLVGFIAYAAVLVEPYLELVGGRVTGAGSADQLYGGGTAGRGAEANELSLWVFLSVLAFGTALGIWTLLLNPATRVHRATGSLQP